MSNVNTLGSFGDTSNSSLMFRNKLINGGFNIWQRGTSFSSLSAYTYTADRWLTDGALTSVTRTGANNNVLNFVTPSATQAGIAQRIETAVNSFAAGQVYTISFQANCTVANLQVVATYRAGNTFKSTQLSVDVSSQLTAGSYSSVRTILTLTNAPADFASTDCLQISILTSAANTVNLQNVQIETGTSATPFEQRPIGLELSLCQRYFQFLQTCAVMPLVSSTTEVIILVNPIVSMRPGVTPDTSPSSSLTVNLTNANFVSGAPTGNQWSLYRPGIGYSTKTGTVSWTNEGAFNINTGTVIPSLGATFNANSCRLTASGTSGITLNCEL